MQLRLYQWEDIEAALAVGVAAFAAAYLTDGLAIAILAGIIFFLVSLACFEAVRAPDHLGQAGQSEPGLGRQLLPGTILLLPLLTP